MKSKMKSLVVLMAICGSFALGPVEKAAPRDGEVWAGITYLAAKRGASAETGLALGAIGIIDAAAWGFGVGMVAGPAGGVIAGAATSL
jgi:hypothetical protein